jgi:hypothetical protein
LLLVLVSCRGGDGASCGKAGGALQVIARAELDASHVDDATRRDVEDQLPAMRDSLVELCTDGAWAREVRDCMAIAADRTAFTACEQRLTDDQRKAIDRAARGDSGETR